MSYQRLSKEAIRELPLFLGLDLSAVSIVDNEVALDAAKGALLGADVLGFDSESKPVFIKGEVSQGPHLIQLSTLSHAYLFPTHFQPGLDCALAILGSANIEKVGFGLKDDKKLFRDKYKIELVNTCDLAKKLIPISQQKQQVGAKAAVAMVLGARLSKSAQQSNWSNHQLTEQQIKYAANDAYSALYIKLKLQREALL
jgi:ribonuclease D